MHTATRSSWIRTHPFKGNLGEQRHGTQVFTQIQHMVFVFLQGPDLPMESGITKSFALRRGEGGNWNSLLQCRRRIRAV